MPVINIHERILDTSLWEVGQLIGRLTSPRDMLWPRDRWLAFKLDRPLSIGAKGGHGSGHPAKREWSRWVKFLRWAMSRGRSN